LNVPFYVTLAALLFALFYATGRVLWPWTRTHPLRLPIQVALGMGAWIGMSFILCVFGAYRPAVLRAVFWGGVLVAVSLALVRRRAVAAALLAWWREVRLLDLLLLLLLVAPSLLLAVLPVLSFDANVYHLAVPNHYLQAGGFREIPYLVYSNWPLNMELLFGWGLAVQDFVLAKLIHCGTGVLLVVTLYQYCRRRGHPVAGLLAVVLFLVTEAVRIEMSWAYVDVAQAWLFFLAFAVWEEALDAQDPGQRRRGLCLVGVLLGVVAGVKLTGFVCALILAVCHLLLGNRRGRELVLLLGIPLLLWLPWASRSWLATGDPVYPLLYDILGGPYLTGEVVRQLRQWHSGIGMGRSPGDYLLLPYRLVFEAGWGWGRFNGRLHIAWAAGFPLAAIGAVLDRRWRLLLVAVLYSAYWALSSQQVRLLIPALPFLAAAAGLGAVRLWRQWLPVKKPDLLVAVGCLGAAWGIWSTAEEARVLLDARWSFVPSLSGGLERNNVICLGRRSVARGLPDYMRHVNEELPPDARVLFLKTNGGFFCEREYVCDSSLEVSQMATMLQKPEWLREEGITHVVLARDQVTGDRVVLPEAFVTRLEQEEGLRRVFRGVDGDVYRVVQD